MRVLLDTNIIIHRENKIITNYSVAHFFRWLDKLKFDKLIHHVSRNEIKRYINDNPNESIVFKLDAYEEIKTSVSLADEVKKTISIDDKNENDRVDTILLNEVYVGRVDLLITEDKRLRNKAIKLNIGNKVLSINAFLLYVTNEHPELIEYKMLAVKKEIIGNININDIFFDSLRNTYPEFNKWFARKCNENAYVCQDDFGHILGFLYLKTEDQNENYSHLNPIFIPKKRLKIGTFKVDATGFRLGERFIKIIFDNALERNVDEVYVTLYENREELVTLSNLLSKWGFEKYGINNKTKETVLVKQMKQYDYKLKVMQNFPNLIYNKNKYILPIKPEYHTSLIPDSILKNENENDFLAKTPYRYALQKVYISFSYERNIYPGDILLFYRTGVSGNAKYTSVITSLAIIDEVISDFVTKEEFFKHCQNRSIFTKEELENMWKYNRSNLLVVKFIFVKSLNNKVILKFLWDNNIIYYKKGPRPFTRINNNQFDLILKESNTDFSKYWR